jgi:glucose dehydrogenase
VVEKSREGGGSIWTSPAIDETANIVYFVTGSLKSYLQPDPMLFSESMLAFDADTGEMLWHDQVRAADTFDLDFSCHPMIFDAVHPAQKNEVRKCVGAASKAGFYCFNRYTGQRYWKAMLTSSGPSSGPILNSTAVAYNRIFVVSNAAPVRGRSAMSVTAALHAYTGDIMWWIGNPAHVRGPVAVANGVFYQGFDDGTLEAVDVNSGERLFTHKLPGLIRSGMAISNGTLYTATGDTLGWRPGGNKKYGVYAFSPDGQ